MLRWRRRIAIAIGVIVAPILLLAAYVVSAFALHAHALDTTRSDVQHFLQKSLPAHVSVAQTQTVLNSAAFMDLVTSHHFAVAAGGEESSAVYAATVFPPDPSVVPHGTVLPLSTDGTEGDMVGVSLNMTFYYDARGHLTTYRVEMQDRPSLP